MSICRRFLPVSLAPRAVLCYTEHTMGSGPPRGSLPPARKPCPKFPSVTAATAASFRGCCSRCCPWSGTPTARCTSLSCPWTCAARTPAFLPFSQAQQDLLGRVVREKERRQPRLLPRHDRALPRGARAREKTRRIFIPPTRSCGCFWGELEGVPDKLLYLDIDTMCLSDIGQLYDTDIAGFEYGAVLDHMGKFWISPTYCNSGVLLLNLPRLRETKLLQRCRDYIEGHRLVMPDQTALHRPARGAAHPAAPLQRAAGAARGHRRQTLLPRHPLGPLLPHLQLQAVGARKSARKAPPATALTTSTRNTTA